MCQCHGVATSSATGNVARKSQATKRRCDDLRHQRAAIGITSKATSGLQRSARPSGSPATASNHGLVRRIARRMSTTAPITKNNCHRSREISRERLKNSSVVARTKPVASASVLLPICRTASMVSRTIPMAARMLGIRATATFTPKVFRNNPCINSARGGLLKYGVCGLRWGTRSSPLDHM
jgi:hypothetical protein